MRHSVSAACRVFLSLSISPSFGTCSSYTGVYNVHVIEHMMSSGSGRWFSNLNFSKTQFISQMLIRRAKSNWTNGEICRWTLDADRIQCTLHEACVYHMCIRMQCRRKCFCWCVGICACLKIAKTWEKLSSMDDSSLSKCALCVRRRSARVSPTNENKETSFCSLCERRACMSRYMWRAHEFPFDISHISYTPLPRPIVNEIEQAHFRANQFHGHRIRSQCQITNSRRFYDCLFEEKSRTDWTRIKHKYFFQPE